MKNIAVLAGDGIGQEVVPQAIRVLQAVTDATDINLHFAKIGGEAYDEFQQHCPDVTKNLCQECDAVLFGSVGGPVDQMHLPKWQNCEANSILALRKAFKLSVNLRPARIYPELASICPLKENIVKNGVDILIVRELLGDLYFGEHKQFTKDNKRHATDLAEYDEDQIATCAHHAFQAAKQRRQKVTSVDKANVLDTSKLWREIVTEVSKEYPEVTLEHMLVDNCGMQLITNPGQFDIIVTANLFGDILSDAASVIPGSLGLMPSASLNAQGFGLYEPSGGSAPDIAGKNIANPIAQILSVAMLLRYSFGMHTEANKIETAINKTLQEGFCTQDIYTEGKKLVSTVEMTDAIIGCL